MRSRGWQKSLVAYLAQVRQAPFQPGKNDCALFAAGAVAAQTGQDYAAPYRGRYTTISGGLRVLRRDGFADHIALAAHHLPEKPPVFASPGDLAVVEVQDGPALGVVQGSLVYVLGPDGVRLIDAALIVRAFGVI